METREEARDGIARDILQLARNELVIALPQLDLALHTLSLVPGEDVTSSLATEGAHLYYTSTYVIDRYCRGQKNLNRAYLHLLLHCLFRHLGKAPSYEPTCWNLACDVVVEHILDSLQLSCLPPDETPARTKFYHSCQAEMRVLTAERVYGVCRQLPVYTISQLQRLFFQDDHTLWYTSPQQDQYWQNMAQRTQTALSTLAGGDAVGGEALREQLSVSARDDVDYRAFLRRFATPREVLGVDGDAFDPIYYCYGLARYGNMPLIEPLETREERRIEQLVIAIDTSMSTQGELVREFLRCTWGILRSMDTFTRRLEIRIIQCDDQIRSDTIIHSTQALEAYMDQFTLCGGSATDFRPVFEYISAQRQQGALRALRGLLYFTDGMGHYPAVRPPYDVAFLYPEEPPAAFPAPLWVIRVHMTLSTLERASHTPLAPDSALDAMPEL